MNCLQNPLIHQAAVNEKTLFIYYDYEFEHNFENLPELHLSFHQSQREEVLFAALLVVEEYACHVRGSELHSDTYSVVRFHGWEGQIRFAAKRWDVILYH